jgi:hypothetical protein
MHVHRPQGAGLPVNLYSAVELKRPAEVGHTLTSRAGEVDDQLEISGVERIPGDGGGMDGGNPDDKERPRHAFRHSSGHDEDSAETAPPEIVLELGTLSDGDLPDEPDPAETETAEERPQGPTSLWG